MKNKVNYLPSNEDGKLVNALIKIEGRELKYRELCNAVDMPVREGNTRASQLDKIRNYCQLDTVDNVYPTRYIVQEVYPEADALINELDKDSYQAAFEAAHISKNKLRHHICVNQQSAQNVPRSQ